MRAISTRWQPKRATHLLTETRDAVGYARRFRTLIGVRSVDGFGRGAMVPMGIRLKAGET